MTPELSNHERLLTHVKKDTLAYKLVAAAIASEPIGLAAALKQTLEARVQEIRSKFDDGKV